MRRETKDKEPKPFTHPQITYPPMTPTCAHCYCITVYATSGPHRKCCNCGNQQAAQKITFEVRCGNIPVHDGCHGALRKLRLIGTPGARC